MLLAIVVFILILGVTVFVHELGHFVSAKRSGVKVEEFGFGFPPRLFSVRRGETIYSINLLPLGGFVKIYGEDGAKDRKEEDKERAFYTKPILTRAKILSAGVAMNFVLAAVIFTFGFWIGLPAIIEGGQPAGAKDIKVQVIAVAPASPAAEAGLEAGDQIVELYASGETLPVTNVEEMQIFVERHKGSEMLITMRRGGETLEKKAALRADHPADEGPLGVALARTAIISYPWYESLWKGLTATVSLTWFIIATLGAILWQLVTTGRLAVEVAGPVGVFDLTNQAAQMGISYVLQLAALLNINLGIINALPFPALDGGRLAFLAVEKIKGKPVSQQAERIVHTVGFALLILLMLAVTWRDLARIF